MDVGSISRLPVDDRDDQTTVAFKAVDVLHFFFSKTEWNHSTFQLAKLEV